ncbi:MAG: pirin family protein [Steroidobacteraceae bacterium]
MQALRRAQDRGHARHGWLESWHSFSFADYFDPQHMGFSALRVINDDVIAPAQGFGTHGHRDMEIITYVLSGELAHRDSMGNGSTIRPGDVQRMSAGRGVQHSEFNASRTDPVHLLQIWIEPNVRGIEPGYEEQHFGTAEKRGRLCLIASPDAGDGSVTIHQDARVYAGLFEAGERAALEIAAGRSAYVHVARGSVAVNGRRLGAGDALKLAQAASIEIAGGDAGEVLVFDLPQAAAP